MDLNRRDFLCVTTGTLALSVFAPSLVAQPTPRKKYQAVAFDAFPIFDPRPIVALTEELFPGKGQELTNTWRTRQFEYTWLRTLSERYLDFRHVTDDALVFSARLLKLDLPQEQRSRLLNAYSTLKPWPDVLPALQRLQSAGVKLAFLSNFTRDMLEANIKNSDLDGCFDHVLTTDDVRAFKPAPRAYQMGIDALKLSRDEIVFAAFAGWDAAGAKSFGYRTFWVNRQNLPVEELGFPPDGAGGMADLVDFVLGRSAPPSE